MVTWKQLMKDQQWAKLTPRMDPLPDAPIAVVALDPAAVTGWAVIHVDEEPRFYHGECELDDVLNWVRPLVAERQVLCAVERGFIPQLGGGRGRMAAESNIILLQQRIGRALEKAVENFALAAPIWVPTAQQWRAKFPGWVGRTRGREQHKARACAVAEQLTGQEMKTQAHWYTKGRRVGANAGRVLDNEADAICMADAALRHFNAGAWPLWEDISGW